MPSSSYNVTSIERALLTLESIATTIEQLKNWNCNIESPEEFYASPNGMQLLAADCMILTAIGEGINKCNRLLPQFLSTEFPLVPWGAIIGMRNHIAHGYFEIDADIVFSAVKSDIIDLSPTIEKAISILKASQN